MLKNNYPSHIVISLIKLSQPQMWIYTLLPAGHGLLAFGGKANLISIATLVFYSFFYNLIVYSLDWTPSTTPAQPSLDHTAKSSLYSNHFIITCLINLPIIIYLFINYPSSARIALMVSLIIAIVYSHPAIRARDRSLLGLFCRGLIGILPMIVGLEISNMNQWPLYAISAVIFWIIGSYIAQSIPQIARPHSNAQNNIAALLGIRKAGQLSFICFGAVIIFILIGFRASGFVPAILFSFYLFNASFFLKYRSDARATQYRRAWRNCLWLNYVISSWLILYLFVAYDPMHLGWQFISIASYSLIGIALLQLFILLHNTTSFRMPKINRLEEWPKISILIHAFNQADNIASTILAALGQNYPNYEIIFADLGSDDNTAKIASSYNDKKFKSISINPPPSGWSDDSWASQQLLNNANGKYCLLLRADTVLLPNALSSIASLLAGENKKDLVSLLATDQNKTLAQKTVLSQNQALFLSAYPAAYLFKNYPGISSAYGGIIAFDREKIVSVRGFDLVKASPLEDMDLPARAKLLGLKTAYYLAGNLAVSQNHADLKLILSQNIQRFYPTLRFHYPTSVHVFLSSLAVFTGPLVLLGLCIVQDQYTYIPLVLIALACQFIIRFIVAVRGKQNVFAVLAYPISNLVTMVTLAASVTQYELLKPRWQKRTEI